jgi:hypothetical protein
MCAYLLCDSRVSVLVATRCLLHESNCKHRHSQGYPLVRLDAQLNANIGAELSAPVKGCFIVHSSAREFVMLR